MVVKVIDCAGVHQHHAGAPEGVEFRLADFAAHLPGFAYIIRRDHSGLYSLPFVSPGFEEKFGVSHEVVRHDIRPLRDLYHPQDRLKLQSAFDASAELLTPLAVEYRAYHPLRGEFWIETRAAPAPQRDGSLLWHGIALDITARKRVEEELIVREREFRTVAESSTDLIFRYDRQCRRTYVNPAVCRLFGRSRGDLLGGTPQDNEALQADAQVQEYMDAIHRVFNTGQVEHFPVSLPVAGRHISYDSQLIPELDAGGSVVSVFCVARDVTALKHVERKMGRYFEGMPGFAFTLRTPRQGKWTFAFASKGIFDLYGLSPEDVRDDAGLLLSRIHPDDIQLYVDEQLACLRTRKPFQLEFRLQVPGRALCWVECRAMCEEELDGVLVWHGLVMDVTQRQQVQRKLADREAFLTSLLDAIPVPVFYKDRAGRYRGFNTAYESFHGVDRNDLIGRTVFDLDPPELARAYNARDEELYASDTVQIHDSQAFNAAGETRDVIYCKAVLQDSSGSVTGLVGTMLDISDRKRMENELARREQEFRTLVEHSSDTVARYGPDFRRKYVNPAFAALAEGGAETLMGKTPREYPGGDNAARYEEMLAQVFASGRQAEFELRWNGKDGREVCSLVSLTPEFDETGKTVESVLAVGRDITELHASRQKIHQMAFYDALTGLPNRALFHDRLRQIITDASWHGQRAGVMMIDMDHFKTVNDTMGHAVGDELLREAASRLTDCVRSYDTVARLGGDEFAVLLPDIREAEDLGRVASKMLARFQERFLLSGKEVFVSCSVGIAVYPADSSEPEDLVKFADSAMYFAKRSGRSGFRFYSRDLTASAKERLFMESELRRAMERCELSLHFQPKVELVSGEMTGSEALLRWQHPSLGMVSPTQFIPIAEDSGLIVDIGRWVLWEACRAAARWNGEGKPLHKVAINLSGRQFQVCGLVETVSEALQGTGCHSQWIELEITESLLLDEDGRAREILEALRAMGVSIAIDDFGTGYSALSYLTRFPIDTLKIDRSFIHSVTTDHYRAELVRAILSIARCLKQQVVAEGVETLEQAAFLEANGCQVAQGYLFSKPLPMAELEKLPRRFGAGWA